MPSSPTLTKMITEEILDDEYTREPGIENSLDDNFTSEAIDTQVSLVKVY